MTTNVTKQMPLYQKFHKAFVAVYTHVVLGGGQFSSSKTCIYTGRSTNYLRNNRSGCSHDNACIGCFIQ